MQFNATDFQVYDRDARMYVPGSIQCLTSCKFLVLSKLGSMTLFVCFRNLIANIFLRKTQKDIWRKETNKTNTSLLLGAIVLIGMKCEL